MMLACLLATWQSFANGLTNRKSTGKDVPGRSSMAMALDEGQVGERAQRSEGSEARNNGSDVTPGTDQGHNQGASCASCACAWPHHGPHTPGRTKARCNLGPHLRIWPP